MDDDVNDDVDEDVDDDVGVDGVDIKHWMMVGGNGESINGKLSVCC